MKKRSIGLIGASTPVAIEIMRVLSMHPMLELTWVCDEFLAGQRLVDVYPGMAINLKQSIDLFEPALLDRADLVINTLSLRESTDTLPTLITNTPDLKLVDTSQLFCPGDKELFHRLYGLRHPAPQQVADFSYGWTHSNTQSIATSSSCAVPSPVASALITALEPLARAGVSTNTIYAAVQVSDDSSANESIRDDSIRAERILDHPAILQSLTWLQHRGLADSAHVSLTTTSAPLANGLYATLFVPLPENLALASIDGLYREAYDNASFIRLLSQAPELKHVLDSKRIHLHLRASEDTLCINVTLDPRAQLAMQAVACANLMLQLPEEAGLMFCGRSC